MDIKTLLKKYGTATAIAKAFGVSRQAVSRWIQTGKVPLLRQYEVELARRRKRR
jgi:DNA invertase Pin-like site-specific DNA recombinase